VTSTGLESRSQSLFTAVPVVLVQLAKRLDKSCCRPGRCSWPAITAASLCLLATADDFAERAGGLASINCLAFSRDGRMLALGGEDGSITLLDWPSLTQRQRWTASKSEIRTLEVRWLPDVQAEVLSVLLVRMSVAQADWLVAGWDSVKTCAG
jgi:hypothetical protein